MHVGSFRYYNDYNLPHSFVRNLSLPQVMNFYIYKAFAIGDLLCVVGLLIMAGEEEVAVVLLIAANTQSTKKHQKNDPHVTKCVSCELFLYNQLLL